MLGFRRTAETYRSGAQRVVAMTLSTWVHGGNDWNRFCFPFVRHSSDSHDLLQKVD